MVVFSLLAAAGIAAAATPVPERRGDRWVYDSAEVIAAADESRIEQIATELFRKTGAAVVVITVPALENETIDQLAVRVGQDWGVGKKGQDRGLVVAFSRDDRKVYVATGYGTEGFLPDGKVGALIDQRAIPHLRADRFSDGLRELVVGLAAVAAQAHGVDIEGMPVGSTPVVREPRGLGFAQVIVMIMVALVIGYLAFRHPWILLLLMASARRGGGFGGGGGHGGFGGGGFGGGGAGRGF